MVPFHIIEKKNKVYFSALSFQYQIILEIFHQIGLIVVAKEIRSILELAVPAWHSGLTKQQSADIERVQKISFKLILGDQYENYDNACNFFSTETLEQRRVKLCLKFASKNLKSENSLFIRNTSARNTRQKPKLVKEIKCRTKRFEKSSIPYLSRLLNTASRRKLN